MSVSEIRVGYRADNDGMVILYEDNGTGISYAVRPSLFKRGKGKNTGYGLFLIREILDITKFTLTETGTFGNSVRFEIFVLTGFFRATPPHHVL
jgi:sensor histidine kinase regulating citrate/malate metabolism